MSLHRQQIVAAVAASLATIVALDALWLGVITRSFVQERLGPLLLAQPRWGAAALFYLLYASGVVGFAVRPALRSGRWREAALTGAAFGFVAYMTYDLTNLATLRGWSVEVVLLDIAWGALVTSVAAAAGYAAGRALQ